MYKTKIRATEQPITVNIEGLAAMLSCGCATARKIGEPVSYTHLNSNISTHTVDALCEILECKVEDVLLHIPSNSMK